VTYRAFEELFRMAKEVWGAYEYTFHVNLLEIYNENVRDLLVKKVRPWRIVAIVTFAHNRYTTLGFQTCFVSAAMRCFV
jgi:hypothetical protein